MTTTAPNLGKSFTSRASRPATDDDIAILAPGDWISERDHPFSWQFKRWDGDMCIGTFEGKEFLVPRHLLTVCTVVNDQATKFYWAVKRGDIEFKVGDAVQHKNYFDGEGPQGVVVEVKTGLIKAKMDDGKIYSFSPATLKLRNKVSVDIAPENLIKSQDNGFEELIEQVDKAISGLSEEIKIGDRFAINPGVTNECTIIAVGDKYRIIWSLNGEEQEVDKTFFDKFKPVKRIEEASTTENGRWNPAHFGEVPHQIEVNGQTTIFYDTSGEPPEPDDFDTREEYEEAWKQWEDSQQEYFSLAGVDVAKEPLKQNISPSGQLSRINTPQPSIASDSPTPTSSKQISKTSATDLLDNSQPQTSLSAEVLARISPLLEVAPELKELADRCFLNSSDFCKSSSLRLYFGKTLAESYQVEKGEISSKSLMRLQRWGMWGVGKLGTAIASSPKTESASSLWVFTGDIRATIPKSGKKSLSEILGAIPVNEFTGKQIDKAFTLRANSYKAGVDNESHPNTFVLQPVVLDVHHASGSRLYEEESPCLLSPGAGGRKFSVVYCAAEGDRIYTEQAPCLRSQKNAGTGAYKIREYNGEEYLERPINATEAEQLMGWEVNSTATGINKEGDEMEISQTQRIKMLGNGVIPGEVTDILSAIKPLLERKLESEVPEKLRFAYRQLRQKGMSHSQALNLLTS